MATESMTDENTLAMRLNAALATGQVIEASLRQQIEAQEAVIDRLTLVNGTLSADLEWQKRENERLSAVSNLAQAAVDNLGVRHDALAVALVEAAIPLEAMNMAGRSKYQCDAVWDGIQNAIRHIRAALPHP